ncbi:MAG: 2'-5' RNA ligase family protein [Patescibacteria group bacterium]
MRYFIAHLLEGKAKMYHEALTRALSDRFALVPLHERVPPHLTVKIPFEADETEIKDMERVLRSFARTRAPAHVTLSDFGHFGFRTIYLDVARSPEATALTREALRVLRDNLPWLPRPPLEGNKLHASVARFLPRQKFRRVWRLLEGMHPRFTTTLDNLAILKREDKAWTVHTLIPLTGEVRPEAVEHSPTDVFLEGEALVP